MKQLWLLPTISTSLFFLFKALTYFLKKSSIRNRTVQMNEHWHKTPLKKKSSHGEWKMNSFIWNNIFNQIGGTLANSTNISFLFFLTIQLKGLAFVIIFTSIWLKHSIKLNLTESKLLNYFENTLKKKIKFQCFDKK